MDRQTTITLPEHLSSRLAHLAQSTGQPTSHLIAQALQEHLDDMEDARRAEEILARVHSGQERVYSADEVRKELGLDD